MMMLMNSQFPEEDRIGGRDYWKSNVIHSFSSAECDKESLTPSSQLREVMYTKQ